MRPVSPAATSHSAHRQSWLQFVDGEIQASLVSERIARLPELDRSPAAPPLDLEEGVSPGTLARRRPMPIQTQLAVGPAGDRFEREADAVADRVVAALRRPAVRLHNGVGQGRAQRMTGQPASDDGAGAVARTVQRVSVLGQAGGDVDSRTEREIRSEESRGRPLPRSVRSKLEPAFGADFGSIRVHEGRRSSALNDRIQAQAFTTGNHVFFRDGFPDMSSSDGQHLLAHELTHTIQQGATSRRAQRSFTIQRFLDPSQQAQLTKTREELKRLLHGPKGSGKKQATRKKKIADLRAAIEALETSDRTTPDPSLAAGASILPGAVGQAVAGVADKRPEATPAPALEEVIPAEPQAAAEPETDAEQTPAAAATVDPLVAKRAMLLSDLDAAETTMKGIRRTATTALRARMPREFLENRIDIDRIVSGLPSQAVFESYRTRIEALESNEVGGADKAVGELVGKFSDESIRGRVERYVDYLNDLTTQEVTALVDNASKDNGKQLTNYLLAKYGKRLEVGPLRSYYRSSHDKDENATYGMSFDLSNTPLAVHCHTAGSGSLIKSVSLKRRTDEGGKAVLSDASLGPLADGLIVGIGRSVDNPRTVIVDIKEGRRQARRWSRPGL